MDNEISEIVKDIRKKNGLTQEAFAESIGITKSNFIRLLYSYLRAILLKLVLLYVPFIYTTYICTIINNQTTHTMQKELINDMMEYISTHTDFTDVQEVFNELNNQHALNVNIRTDAIDCDEIRGIIATAKIYGIRSVISCNLDVLCLTLI